MLRLTKSYVYVIIAMGVIEIFYQNILSEISPYLARVRALTAFGEHRHADIEFHYCLKGSFDAVVNKKTYKVNKGELLLISPMAAHAIPDCNDLDGEVLTVIVGVSFLKKFFSFFSQARRGVYLITESACPDIYKSLAKSLDELSDLSRLQDENRDLLKMGSLYKICSYLIDVIADDSEAQKPEGKEMIKVANIEKALDMIHYEHAKPLTLEDAARATGYGKSNFCKIFKAITGDTFHNVLNRQRVESACGLLSETNLSISDISAQVGFEETKTFCRVFKSVTGVTPGQYRRQN